MRDFGRHAMPTTRAARRAAAARLLIELPTVVLGLVLYQLPLAHDIAAVAPTCHQLCDAAKLAGKARPFSGEVVTIHGVPRGNTLSASTFARAAVTAGGHIITSSYEGGVNVWLDRAYVRTIQLRVDFDEGEYPGGYMTSLAVFPGGARVASGSMPNTLKLWTLDGTLERTLKLHIPSITRLVHGVPVDEAFPSQMRVFTVVALPDNQHALSCANHGRREKDGQIMLFNALDGKILRTFARYASRPVFGLALLSDGLRFVCAGQDGARIFYHGLAPPRS